MASFAHSLEHQRDAARRQLRTSLAGVLGDLSVDLNGSGHTSSSSPSNMLPPSLHQQSSNMAYGSLAAANAVAAANHSNSNALLAQSLGLPGTSSSLLIEESLKAAANKSSHGNVTTTSQPAGSALSAASLLWHGLGLATRNNNTSSLNSFALTQQLQLQQQQQQQSDSGVKQLLDRVKAGLLQDYLAQEKTRLIQEAYLKLLQQNQTSAQVPPSSFANAHLLHGFKSLEQGTATSHNLSLAAAPAVTPSPAGSAPPSQSLPPAPAAAAVEPPSARRVADAIGTQLRTGQPYIDVTALPGLEETGVVAPRNRGGVTESFPEVRFYVSISILHSFYDMRMLGWKNVVHSL